MSQKRSWTTSEARGILREHIQRHSQNIEKNHKEDTSRESNSKVIVGSSSILSYDEKALHFYQWCYDAIDEKEKFDKEFFVEDDEGLNYHQDFVKVYMYLDKGVVKDIEDDSVKTIVSSFQNKELNTKDAVFSEEGDLVKISTSKFTSFAAVLSGPTDIAPRFVNLPSSYQSFSFTREWLSYLMRKDAQRHKENLDYIEKYWSKIFDMSKNSHSYDVSSGFEGIIKERFFVPSLDTRLSYNLDSLEFGKNVILGDLDQKVRNAKENTKADLFPSRQSNNPKYR